MFPSDTHHRIIIVSRITEITSQLSLIVGIFEVIHPTSGIGIYISDIGIQAIPRTRKSAVDGLSHDISLIIHISGIFGNHYHLVWVNDHIGVEIALRWIQAIATKSGSCIIINLILIVTILICNALVNKATGASLDKGIGG